MMDMLVRLYDLPDIEEDLRRLEREGFLIRRPGAYERHLVADWVGRKGLRELGYAYGVIGGVGPADFYARAVGAMPIEGSSPGIYMDILPEP